MNPGLCGLEMEGEGPGAGFIVMVWFRDFAFRTLLSILYLQIQA
jgi:hypothetical protein